MRSSKIRRPGQAAPLASGEARLGVPFAPQRSRDDPSVVRGWGPPNISLRPAPCGGSSPLGPPPSRSLTVGTPRPRPLPRMLRSGDPQPASFAK